jgi:hypothetical protein
MRERGRAAPPSAKLDRWTGPEKPGFIGQEISRAVHQAQKRRVRKWAFVLNDSFRLRTNKNITRLF